MSTLTDLFSKRIGGNRRAVFIEETTTGFLLMISSEKLPSKDPFQLTVYNGVTIEEMLSNAGVVKENIYYVIPPGSYFKSRIQFPFTDRHKIEGVIEYEVRDSLPAQDLECVTDFYLVGNEAQAFTVKKELIRSLIHSFGRFAENLRAVIPGDVALFFGMKACVENDEYTLLRVSGRSVYIQYIAGGRIVNGVYVGLSENEKTIDELRRKILPHIIMNIKKSGNAFIWLNRTADADDELVEVLEGLFHELNVSCGTATLGNVGSYYPGMHTFNHSVLSLFGAVRAVGSSWPVNLLKNEFKPRARGYVSVREFTFAGILLLCLFVLGTVNLTYDIRYRKQQVAALRQRIEEIGRQVFGNTTVDEAYARKQVSELKERINVLQKSTDRHLSSLKLLKELSLYFPGNVVIEYTDIIIDKERIKLSGNVRSFSDIDTIREDLLMSDLFTAVDVTNTGTTGSTGGFTVTFTMDITVVQE